MPVDPLFLYDRLDFERFLPSADAEIHRVAQLPPSRVETTAFKRRIEGLSTRYLDGYKIHIHTASLRGPFGKPWQNPWHPDRTQASKRQQIVDQAYGTTSSGTMNSTKTHAQARKAHTKESGPGTTHPKPTTLARTKSRPQQQPLLDNKGVQSLIGESDVSGRHPHIPDCAIDAPNDTGHDGILTQKDASSAGPFNFTAKATAPLSNPQTSSLPTPTDSGLSDGGHEDTTHVIVTFPAIVQSKLDASIERPPRELKPPAFQPVNKPAVATSNDVSVGVQGRVVHASPQAVAEKRCAGCQKVASRLRKGPKGPGTLCSSCGSKWTHQQKKCKTAAQASRSKGLSQDDEEHVTAVPTRKRRKYGNYPIRRDSIQRAGKATAKKDGDPQTRHEQIYQKIFPDSLQQLDERLNEKAVGLRQGPDPRIERWSQSTGDLGAGDQKRSSLLSRVVSPRKERSERLEDGRRAACTSLDLNKGPKESLKRRRQVDFDTPKARAQAKPSNASPLTEQTEEEDRILASFDGPNDDAMVTSASAVKFARGGACLSAKVYPSTQVMMQMADDEFKYALASPAKDATRRASSQGTANRSVRGRFGIGPRFSVETQSPLKHTEFNASASGSRNTQDLISRAMSLDVSPTKRASFNTGLTDFDDRQATRLLEESVPNKAGAAPEARSTRMRKGLDDLWEQSPEARYEGVEQQDVQQDSSLFDLDAAIELGQGFLET